MTPEQASQAVTDRAYVEARHPGGCVQFRGHVVDYAPVLTIEDADGERHTWPVGMCEEVAR